MNPPRVPKHRSAAATAASVAPRPRRERGSYGATAGRPYADEEEEFILAVRAYQERTGVKFPTFTELLAVLKGLGYSKG